MGQETVSLKLIKKIMIAFLLTTLVVGISYITITLYFSQKYFEETSQRLNAELANHLIEEKFQNASPFLEDGAVNKPLFGDIMHDMMAVNRGIEVYLLNEAGAILYSVVLDHSDTDKPLQKVDLAPIHAFVQCNGNKYILGDDPRNIGQKKIFSAAPFEVDDQKGYIYIILAGQPFEEVTNSLISSYFIQLGLGASIAAIILGCLFGIIAIWYLTKNLREIIQTVRRFRDGDLSARIDPHHGNDLSVLSDTYNSMADTIVANIEELQSVESLRRELIANVSHDLRTPLAITQGYIETLQMKKDKLTPEESDKYLEIVQKSAEKLSGLIDQLFEYSKLEAKQIEPLMEPFSISDLAHDVYEKYEQLAAKKNITLSLDVEERLPMVLADIKLVDRVIQNLMDNALKYTSENGSVQLEMKADDSQVYVSVKDNGKGIAEEELTQIFERYRQTKTADDAHKQGVGLGLAIAKKIMEIHNSTINVISKPNIGTSFQFYLPTAQV